MNLKEFMENQRKLTLEEHRQLNENREAEMEAQYCIPLSKGTFYPIPKLVGAYRSIVIDEDTVGAEDITLGFARFEPGAFHEKHAHATAEETAYMISGRMVGGVSMKPDDDDDVECIWEPGDVLWVPRGAYHWFYNPFDEPQTHVFMYTRKNLETAGYSIESQGFKEIGLDIQDKQRAGENNTIG